MATLTDGWLTGFTNAENCFNRTITTPESLTTPFSEIPKKAATVFQLTCNLQKLCIRFIYIFIPKKRKTLINEFEFIIKYKAFFIEKL